MEVFGSPPRKIQIFPVPKENKINVNGITGSLLIRELDLLFNFGRNFPAKGTHVEVGSGDALAICTVVSGMVASNIENPNVHLIGRFGPGVLNDIHQAGLNDIIRTKYGDPVLLSEMFPDGSIDSIYMDSEHTYDEFRKELGAWFPKKKKTGVFWGHDGCGNVRRALRDFCEETSTNLSIIEPPKAHFMWTLSESTVTSYTDTPNLFPKGKK